MTSVERDWFQLTAHQRPTVGDMKTSAIGIDHMGWLYCDGRTLLISEFPQLYNVIGKSFGSTAATNFKLPNPIGRVPGFVGTGGSNDPNGALTTRALGDIVGEERHRLNIDEMPSHTHGSSNVNSNTNGDGFTTTNGAHTHTGTTSNAGWAANQLNVDAGGVVSQTAAADNDGSHNHTFTTDSAGAHQHQIFNTGGSNFHNNIQPTLFVGNMFIYCGRPFYGSNAITPTFPYTSGIYVQSTAAPGSNLV